MIIYLINIILITIWALILNINTVKHNKKIFCILASVQWIFLSGLRNLNIGADTMAYKVSFDTTKNWSWEYIINRFYSITFQGENGRDAGYAIFEKLAQYITQEYQVYLIIIAIIFMVPLSIFIYKYSKSPYISFIIYSSLFYSFFAITGHRQTIATGIALFLGYELIKKRKLFTFLVLILLSATIHKSVICLIPFYFIATKKITKKYSLFIVVSFIVAFKFKNQLMNLLATFIGYESYAGQYVGAGAWNFTVIFLVVVLVSIWRAPRILSDTNTYDVTIWYNAAFMALLFLPLTFVNPSAMRVVQYFSIFLMMLIPEIIKSFDIDEQPIIYYVGTSLMVLLLIKNNPYYLFFWQR